MHSRNTAFLRTSLIALGLFGTFAAHADDLNTPAKREIAMELVSSAENTSLDWRAQYAYIEDIKDGRGYTAGLVGFTSADDDMLALVTLYDTAEPGNVLSKYIPALTFLSKHNSGSHQGLDPTFKKDWITAAADPVFQAAQDQTLNEQYFNPALSQATTDGLGILGQFIYYDAYVMHGPGNGTHSFGGIRKAALANAKTPAQGGDETTYLNAFLDARRALMLKEPDHKDNVDRIDTEQRAFLKAGNLNLDTPLRWTVNEGDFSIP
ncbi:MAG: Chitosanase [Luteibacter sp.]|uniref:chitosanase n=1 Tax=Luteibacter sp. TaxID=1886636 RepID=UPI001384676C|nr:chitosanase [Luteibacter sp.]KAF1005091.1 MAG: Chitosanase [Luteibacter sp.]